MSKYIQEPNNSNNNPDTPEEPKENGTGGGQTKHDNKVEDVTKHPNTLASVGK